MECFTHQRDPYDLGIVAAAMAETMQISFDKIANLVLLCGAAWEV